MNSLLRTEACLDVTPWLSDVTPWLLEKFMKLKTEVSLGVGWIIKMLGYKLSHRSVFHVLTCSCSTVQISPCLDSSFYPYPVSTSIHGSTDATCYFHNIWPQLTLFHNGIHTVGRIQRVRQHMWRKGMVMFQVEIPHQGLECRGRIAIIKGREEMK